jgi:hypothetical protein
MNELDEILKHWIEENVEPLTEEQIEEMVAEAEIDALVKGYDEWRIIFADPGSNLSPTVDLRKLAALLKETQPNSERRKALFDLMKNCALTKRGAE